MVRILALFVVVLTSFARADGVKNVILIIGDGMGVSHIAAASQTRAGKDGSLTIESMPVTGLMKHHPARGLITDSAASGTAIATGHKANNGQISMTPDAVARRTIAEAASDKGLSVAIITNTAIYDATPAVFLAHASSRKQHTNILAQMIASDATLIVGGDGGYLIDPARKAKSLPPTQQAIWRRIPDLAHQHNRTMVQDSLDFSGTQNTIALFSARNKTNETFGPPLKDITRAAIDRLSNDPDGFFMMIESSDTDKGAHVHDARRVIAGMLELDDALTVALDFARQRTDTLVIVTADHETGGLTVAGQGRNASLDIRWSTGGHSLEWVPIFADGPQAQRLEGVHDNTDIATIIADVLNLQGVGDPLPPR